MKTLLSAAVLMAMAAAVNAETPAFEKGVKLQAAGKDLAIDIGHLVPVASDWDGDGDKDLIVGHFAGGDNNMKLFLNKGTDAKPVLEKGVPISAGGKPIRMDAG